MTADAGMRALHARLSQYTGAEVSRNDQGASFEGGLELQLGRLANALDRQNGIEQARVQGVVPISLGPLDFVITAGQPKLKSHRSSTSDNMSPQEGYIWFVTRLTLSGLNSGDVVNLHKPTASAIMVNATAVHTFTATASTIADGATGTIAAATAGSVSLPHANDLITGFAINLSTVGTAPMTITVSNVSGGPYTYTIPTGSTGLTVTYPQPIPSTGTAPLVFWTSTASAVGNTSVYGISVPTPGLGVADWEPGPLGCFLLPDDTFNLQSGGTLTATEIILTGQGVQIAVQYLLEYLL